MRVCVGGGRTKVAEVQSHNHGVSHVAFSTNSQYIVSVGFQHDKTVSVWDWRKGSIIASNKVSSRVLAVSFSQDSSYFVTAGNRHVRFWYLDASKELRVNSAVPLIGRSGLLGDHRNSVTFCITSSGLLCLFNSSRQLEAWVDLKTASASCLVASEDLVFCGALTGWSRLRPGQPALVLASCCPDCPGVHSSLSPAAPGAQYPHTLALTFDPSARHLACVYSDHSVYVWDVQDVRAARKLYSALYHSGSVWSLEVYPDLPDGSRSCLPPSSFFTCSSDSTIRLWDAGAPAGPRNHCSHDLLKILYVGEKTQHLQ
uniref:Uncharacterized protein n=1 Tax=Tetraodon nigroviridis TaxID=99883 RepID=H3C8M7_TETNG